MLLVTGATGNIGRALIDLLTGDGADIRAVTRNPSAADLPGQVEIVEGDPSHPGTIATALRGVTGLFVNPRAVGAGITELLALARDRGVRRVVALSAINVDDDLADQPSRANGDRNKEVDEAVTRSGLEWVTLRAGHFALNAVRAWGGQIRAGDVVRGPYPAAAEAPIHERDLAAVAARALLTDQFVRRRPVLLTGPQSLTQEEMVAAIGTAIGRALRFEQIPAEAARRGMAEHGIPEPFAAALLALQAKAVGEPAFTTNEVEKVLGRPALTFAEWAADHAADFRNRPAAPEEASC